MPWDGYISELLVITLRVIGSIRWLVRVFYQYKVSRCHADRSPTNLSFTDNKTWQFEILMCNWFYTMHYVLGVSSFFLFNLLNRICVSVASLYSFHLIHVLYFRLSKCKICFIFIPNLKHNTLFLISVIRLTCLFHFITFVHIYIRFS